MIDRLVRLFVEAPVPAGIPSPPAAADGPSGGWTPPGAPAAVSFVVVLAAGGCGPAAGAAVGLALAAAADGAALVATWRPPPDAGAVVDGDARDAGAPALLATPAARRLARVLQDHGLAAVARGRLACLELPHDAGEAVTAMGRATAATTAPSALVVAGPREPALDPLLADAGRVVLAAPETASAALVELALADAARAGRSTAHLPVLPSSVNALARGGLVVAPGLRDAAAAALR